MDSFWLLNANLITPRGIVRGAAQVVRGRIAKVVSRAPRSVSGINLHGAYLAPGFIDLHVWGSPEIVSRDVARGGTTAFLTTLGPEPAKTLAQSVARRADAGQMPAAACLGIHLEGPFVNPVRAGALPRKSMRPPLVKELQRLHAAARRQLRLITIAPELPVALGAIRWCKEHHVIVSLGHSDALAKEASAAVSAGATAVTHVFNGMRPFYHRRASLLDVALTDERLTTMVILDGVHVSAFAFQFLVRAKGPEKIALVSDSITHQGWDVVKRGGTFYLTNGILAGSALTMMQAVRNAVRFGGVSLIDAVQMASTVPARLLGDGGRGRLAVGARADLVAFDRNFSVRMTMVAGRIVYESRIANHESR